MWKMSRALSRPDFDLLLFPTIYSYVPVISRAKKIVMIHDIIAETYPRLTLPKLSSRLFWRTKVGLGRRQADAIVTVSDYSQQGIMRRFNLTREQVFVVGEASDPVFRVIAKPQLSPHLRSLGITPIDVGCLRGRFVPQESTFGQDLRQTRLPTKLSEFIWCGGGEQKRFFTVIWSISRWLTSSNPRQVVLPISHRCRLAFSSSLDVLVLPSLKKGCLPAVGAACGVLLSPLLQAPSYLLARR